jgi:hypothetical protein
VNAGHGPRISDGVDGATVPASEAFPYMAQPNPVPPGGLPIGDLIARVQQQAVAHDGAH